jgi:hypothetical protein
MSLNNFCIIIQSWMATIQIVRRSKLHTITNAVLTSPFNVRFYGGKPPSVLTLPFPPDDLEYDEREVKVIFESFFRKRGWTVEVLFTSGTAH